MTRNRFEEGERTRTQICSSASSRQKVVVDLSEVSDSGLKEGPLSLPPFPDILLR